MQVSTLLSTSLFICYCFGCKLWSLSKHSPQWTRHHSIVLNVYIWAYFLSACLHDIIPRWRFSWKQWNAYRGGRERMLGVPAWSSFCLAKFACHLAGTIDVLSCSNLLTAWMIHWFFYSFRNLGTIYQNSVANKQKTICNSYCSTKDWISKAIFLELISKPLLLEFR